MKEATRRRFGKVWRRTGNPGQDLSLLGNIWNRIEERLSIRVQRLLEKARDLEIIQFTLKHPYVNLMSIESEIREKFGLKD